MLTQAGGRKAREERVIRESVNGCLCVCVCVCVRECYHALGGFDNRGLDVNGFTDMEKEFRLKCTPGS